MSELPEDLVRYLEIRDQQRKDRVIGVLNGLSDRERGLVHDAAVMGYFLGAQSTGRQVVMPSDSTVTWRVVDGCLAHPDLYPLLGGSGEED